jgi:hypothetical protein
MIMGKTETKVIESKLAGLDGVIGTQTSSGAKTI